jgi:hypothetical protein
MSDKNSRRLWRPVEGRVTAASRFEAGGFFDIQHRPKFTFGDREKVFTIGSCFARNIEHHVKRRGHDLLTDGFSVPGEFYNSGEGGRGALNKYNPHSMFVEVARALGEMPEPDYHGLIEISEGSWIDPQTSGLKPNSFDALARLRSEITAVTARIANASLVIITLGLTETFYDVETGLSLNQAPPPLILKRSKRFAFNNATYGDALSAVSKMIDIINKHGNTSKIVLSVSPVPFGSTHTNVDVVTANTYSKSILRAVAQAVSDATPNVDYFPSFEIVSNSPRKIAFEPDHAHVTKDMVAFVMEQFWSSYAAHKPDVLAASVPTQSR